MAGSDCIMTCCFKGALVLLVLALIGYIEYSFYDSYILLAFDEGENLAGAYVNLVLNAVFFTLVVWSLAQTYLTDPGYVGSFVKARKVQEHQTSTEYSLHLVSTQAEEFHRVTVSNMHHSMRDASDVVRMDFLEYQYCDRCDNIKPPRTHHCSVCNRCVMRMDHHCPWVGNCVGVRNHKFFILFLFYASLSCVHIALSVSFGRRNLVSGPDF